MKPAQLGILNADLMPIEEDLADRWPVEDFRQFVTQLDEAVDLARRARASIGERESHELWRELLGEDFPPYTERSGSVPPPPPPGHRSTPQQAPRSREIAATIATHYDGAGKPADAIRWRQRAAPALGGAP